MALFCVMISCTQRQITAHLTLLTAFCWLVGLAGCGDGELRGKSVASPDGGTYLIVEDDNGGYCGPIKIDGVVWPAALHEPGPISPGEHQISCGDESGITFTVKQGTTFHFDYWGP